MSNFDIQVELEGSSVVFCAINVKHFHAKCTVDLEKSAGEVLLKFNLDQKGKVTIEKLAFLE
jgi:hypothetical protein